MKKGLIEVLFYIVLVFGVSFLLTTYVGQRTRVNGESMYPTLHDDDNLIVDKVSYRFSDPRRYDIIVFPYRYKDMYFIKRIIGLPGETVQILDGYVYIDGKKLDEHFCDEKIQNAALASDPITLGDDEYFVLGDNRNASEDSRFPDVGNVRRKEIIGRAWVRIWPFERAGYFICLLAVVFVINTFVVQRTMVSGDSMYPYLHNKDQLMMDKLSYRFHDPERFDIVVFPVVRDGKEEYYIKRVIGLPGETVQIIDGYVYINGEKLDENYGAEVMNDAGRAAEPITLGDDEYFVLGDNRNRSDDSRYENVENLKREKIVGRAWVRIWPLDRICVVRHQ